MDLISVILLIVILANLMLVVISSSCPKDNLNKGSIYISYLFNITTITWWVAVMVLYRIGSSENVDFIARLLYVSATLIASSFYYFSLVFPQKEKSFRKDLYIVSVLNIILIYLIFYTDMVIERVFENRTVAFGKFYWVYVLYIVLFFGISFWRMFKRYRATLDKVVRRQSLSVLVGYLVSGLVAVTTNLFLPWFNILNYQYLGPLSSICVVLSISYAVKRYQLFNLQIVAAETFVFVLWVCVILRICLVDEIASVDLLFLILVIVVGILSIRSVKKEHFHFEKNISLVKELEIANLKLSELDNQKTKFVNLAAHHIASPVTSIKAYLSMLRSEQGKISNTEDLKIVESVMENLVHILRDFLDISRIEIAGVSLKKERVDIVGLLNQIIKDNEVLIENRHINLKKEYDSEHIEVLCDSSQILVALNNILENSISYSKDSSILVSIKSEASFVSIRVEDGGLRSVPHVSDALLSKFSDTKNQKEADVIGRSIGLYVAKKIIEQHAGTFTITVGDGTTVFSVQIPIGVQNVNSI